MFTNEQISWVICLVGASHNKHMKIPELELFFVENYEIRKKIEIRMFFITFLE